MGYGAGELQAVVSLMRIFRPKGVSWTWEASTASATPGDLQPIMSKFHDDRAKSSPITQQRS
jgi:hypothetical protein